MNKDCISFAQVVEGDFEDFKRLRKSVMKEHYARQGLPWNEGYQDKRHRNLFDEEGLRAVMLGGVRIGYVGLRYDVQKDRVIFGRFCIEPAYQGKGIGSEAMKKIFADPICRSRTIFLEVLLKNPAVRLYERLGFARVREDDILACYEKESGS